MIIKIIHERKTPFTMTSLPTLSFVKSLVQLFLTVTNHVWSNARYYKGHQDFWKLQYNGFESLCN